MKRSSLRLGIGLIFCVAVATWASRSVDAHAVHGLGPALAAALKGGRTLQQVATPTPTVVPGVQLLDVSIEKDIHGTWKPAKRIHLGDKLLFALNFEGAGDLTSFHARLKIMQTSSKHVVAKKGMVLQGQPSADFQGDGSFTAAVSLSKKSEIGNLVAVARVTTLNGEVEGGKSEMLEFQVKK